MSKQVTMRANGAALIPVLLLGCSGLLIAGKSGGPSVETVKQLMDGHWQKLLPQGFTERNVLFQDVHLTSANAGSYQFHVSVIIRDYGPGYPPNHYYGTTCVARLEDTFTFWSQGSEWQYSGRWTPPMEATKCDRNPSEGVSAVPLQSLSGSRAGSGPVAAAPPPPTSGSVTLGHYACWANGQARLLLNFTIRAGNQYVGDNGSAGSFTFDPGSSAITFRGGPMANIGARFHTIYYQPRGRPTVSIRNPTNDETAFCERE